MAPQVNIVLHAPAAVEVKISIPEATKDKPKPQEPIDMGETLIASGKHRGKRFKDALDFPHYVKWILNHRQGLVNPNMKLLASYLAAKPNYSCQCCHRANVH